VEKKKLTTTNGLPNGLPNGFNKATQSIKQRLIISVEGTEKQGKTHFALTAPGPIAFFDFDRRLEGTIHKFLPAKEIWVNEYTIPLSLKGISIIDIDACNVLWNRFKQDFKAVLYASNVETIIVDTASEAWELLRLAKFGKLSQVQPFHYGPVNFEFRDLIKSWAYDASKNVIYIHKQGSKYVGDKRTEDYERKGFSEVGYIVQVVVRVFHKGQDFSAEIVSCGLNTALEGMVLSGPDCNFETLSSLVLPDKDI
jgi:hypothetical protein